MIVVYHPDAQAELIESARFYESRVNKLGSDFLNAVDDTVKLIAERPERGEIIQANIRCFTMSRFPYAIYYRISLDHVRILAISHHSRHPDFWRNRLRE
ncbi:MAG: type II toxin-antitoxin system RelE/ParE family toxin [Pirellulales bacterium]|nr:type II toxin-antitoxin system RelE/ParE family toxin [Pirellulales bacterium]